MHVKSRADAVALGMADVWDEAMAMRPPPEPPMATAPAAGGMTKLEAAFWDRLQEARRRGDVECAWHEPITLRLAGRTTYRPDFVSWHLAMGTLWEVKGKHAWEDSLVKLKVAAETFKVFRFVLVRRPEGRGWECRVVDGRGIAAEAWCPPWLA